jgi:pyridoxal phosphate enzyme (YggS family)
MVPDRARRIDDNLARVRQRIAEAAVRSGRKADAVRLVAITKYVGLDEMRALVSAGCGELGESRPQDLWSKAEALAGADIHWHLVGHLQRNKVARTLSVTPVPVIHSADSLRLLKALDQAAVQLEREVPALLEINISGAPQKGGFAPDEVEPLLPQLAAFRRVRLRGLMGMAALHDDPEQCRPEFARLRALRDRLAAVSPPELVLSELSMGMSNDFEQAILERATLVRIGSALFEGLE